ncbi:glutaredoxin family protein [Undibacterium sp. FT79W]|uniref:glutaredoxin family protein n=1 Tax=Undibacterium sp. FT79W TaxID=2762296 RepID=UPI002104C4E5|nr:glutaredoxin family protein [Undibacterium sp. FT79W]
MRYFIYVALFMIAFTLYSRSYCHLCDDMLEQLRAYTADCQFSVEVIDVDTDAELVHLYDELVPVLIGKKPGHPPKEICHYFLDQNALKAFFQA